MQSTERLHVVLRQHGLSNTQQRDEVYVALKRLGPCLPLDLVHRLEGRVSKKTVYETLRVFSQLDVMVRLGGGLIELAAPFVPHYHYFVCTDCGKRVKFWDEQLEKKLEWLSVRRGLTLKTQALELAGACSECARY